MSKMEILIRLQLEISKMSDQKSAKLPDYVLLVPLILIGLTAFRFLIPFVSGEFPKCPIFKFTGLHCPGCGGTRSALALVHLRIGEAFQQHAWFATAVVIGLPLLLWMGAKVKWPRIPGPRYHDRWLWAGLASLLIYGVLRNLEAFSWMAPR